MIDNQMRAYLTGRKNRDKILVINYPFLFLYKLESTITNELGYEPIRQNMPLKEECGDLIRHLGEMDLRVCERALYTEKMFAQVFFSSLSRLEDVYNDEVKGYLEESKNIEKIVRESLEKALSGAIIKIRDEIKDVINQVKRIECKVKEE